MSLLRLPSLLATGWLSLAGSALSAGIEPAHLRCEYRTDPLGIEVARPRLSWGFAPTGAPPRAWRQSAYRILASTNPDKLAAGRGDLWDSGKVDSDRSIHVPYEGRPLRSGERVFWKVRVWDRDGEPTSWSEPALFQMGLLEPEDWKAVWIAHPDPVPPAIPARNGYHSQLVDSPAVTKWVAIDLGAPRSFDRVRLFPARPFDWKPDTPGFLFPLRFRVEVSTSADFETARTVVDRTGGDVENPGTDPRAYPFEPARGRYVRLVVTRQRLRDANHHGFALAEMEVLDGQKNLAKGARVTALDSIESANWSTAFLVDGDRVSHPGNRPEAEPATLLRKEFTLPANVKRATLSVTALGLYEVYLSGERVGGHVLAPGWTDYRTRVQYQTFDVTSRLRKGKNAVGALLGEGWYAGRIGMSDGIFGVLRRVYGTKPYLLAQLDVELENGERLRIVSDGSWTATREGPVRKSDLLDGEVYDARRELPGWNRPGFQQDESWKPVEVREEAEPRLVAQPNEPIRVIEELRPVSLNEPEPGVFVFDLGQNMVGRCRLRVRGSAGTTVTIRHAEVLEDDGTIYTANLRSAPQVDRYTLRGDGPEVWEPTFTQHGFRYVEITGLAERPEIGDVTGRVFCSNAAEVGRFECSDPLLEKLWKNILWTQRGNLVSVPTDCPQRDERLGWMGDIQAFSQTAIFNMDLGAFFTKWLRDVRDAQADDGRFPDFAPNPYDPNRRFSGAPGWADGGVIVPWRCWVNYGDRRLLEKHLEAARSWIDYVHAQNPDLIWRRARHNDYNDWLNGNTLRKDGWPTRGGAVPNEVFATAFFANSTAIVARMAAVLGHGGDADRYGKLADRIRAAFQEEFVEPDGRIRGETQAGYALALRFDLVPRDLRSRVAARMVESLRDYDGHLSTGIQSTHRLLLELSRNGHHDEAWRLLTSKTFPSWGYMIENGATTVWERWDGFVEGRGFQNPGMNSFNHWAFGSVGEWMVRHILGIAPEEEHPGYTRFTIRPRPGGGVTRARGAYRSIRGLIESDWKIDGETFTLRITVPPNTTARVYVPADDPGAVTERGKSARELEGGTLVGTEGEAAVFEVGSGEYEFVARRRPDLRASEERGR